MTTSNRPPVVLDTSVVSIFIREESSSHYYESAINEMHPVISFQTEEEVLFGAIDAGWGPSRMKSLDRQLAEYEVIQSTSVISRVSAHLRRDRKKAGRELETADAWIAATALLLACPLATHDRDFADIPNLQLIQAPAD